MIDLYEFQREDVDYLDGVVSALIANEMGTGKTYEAIERDQRIRAGTNPTGKPINGATLVVAPLTTLASTWQHHFESLTDLKVFTVDPKGRSASFQDFVNLRGHVFLVHWEALRLMPELTTIQWLHIIADECHRMKNRKAQQTRALKTISGMCKTAMSGTPVVNRPDELWSVLSWLYPTSYRSYWKFFNRYVDFNVKQVRGRTYREILGPRDPQRLLQEIKPFYVRRRKKDVLKDLPDKYYTEIKVDLTPTQRRAYEMMKKEMVAWIGNQQEELLAAPVVIAQLTRLQQFAVSYADLTPEGRVRLTEPSSKLDALMEILDETDGQVVVFSRFKQLVNLLATRLRDASISYVTLTGDVPQEERAGHIDRFQRGEARVFIGSIAAGGIGITLHAASVVVFLDRDWSPALNGQAEDRLHRIGQKNAVQVIDIMARNTVDRGRQQRLDTKKAWIAQMLGDPDPE